MTVRTSPLMLSKLFANFATTVARTMGKPWVFAVSVISILIWAALGPYFNFSDSYQLVINTATTIITYLMVFLIQNTQNRDGAAIQAKLDELIRVSEAQNRYIGIERVNRRRTRRPSRSMQDTSY
jgi:low affinity Fe/Cu permease